MRRLGIASMILAGILSPLKSPAQNAPIPAGMRIRVSTLETGVAGTAGVSSTGVVGHLYRASADSLWLRVDTRDGPLLALDRSSIGLLEISNGRKRNPVKGALWGAGIGLGLGLLAVATLDDCTWSTRHWSFDLCWVDEDVVILGDMVAGAAAGAVIGMFITSERWVPVPRSSLAHPNAAGGRRLGIGIRVPF